ncbi:MAG: rhodanese-like domain-containing protein [Clostridia bacterium]|nr:rhodanese-like domain-containing protein [Clostridia bacterium]MDD4048704.1 rhodanese-like domain-containing protein [Clostridia bacterium]
MEKFDDLMKEFDLDFFGGGKHKINLEKAMELYREGKATFIDVRTDEEVECVSLGFVTHIPVQQIPERLSEIPKDKTVILFCFSATRATIVYTYLKVNEFKDVKILTNTLADIAGFFKPGYVLKNR